MKYALCIGLNHVDPDIYGGWNGQLNACEQDAIDMASLANEQGYQTSILLSSEATMKRVLDALHFFANVAAPGDTILVHYSGHGGQIKDYSLDEKDGLDETWVLYDGMLIDDLLHQAYAAFRKGVRIIVLSDSCHSGTVIKMARMDLGIGISQHAAIRSAPAQVCRQYAATFTPPKNIMRPRVKASVLLISGCQDNQFSYDGEENGLFTGTLLQVWDDGKFRGNYRDFRKGIARLMPPEQTPNLMKMGAKNPFFENERPFLGI